MPTPPAASFYVPRSNDTFEPTQSTVGPWDPGLQHGGPPAALLGRALESLGGRADVRVSHFALEFLGPLAVKPMVVTAEMERPGKRIELLSGSVSVDGRPSLRATAWRIAIGGDRGPIIGVGPADPPPAFPDDEALQFFEGVRQFGYGESLEWRFALGGFRTRGPATVWSRMRVPLVPGEEPSPLVRLLTMVDSANGVSWEIDFASHTFVPVNLTVSITRAPVGEWVGMHAITALAGDGVGTTRARLFDRSGACGEALQTLFVGKR